MIKKHIKRKNLDDISKQIYDIVVDILDEDTLLGLFLLINQDSLKTKFYKFLKNNTNATKDEIMLEALYYKQQYVFN